MPQLRGRAEQLQAQHQTIFKRKKAQQLKFTANSTFFLRLRNTSNFAKLINYLIKEN
jgi:hypothetical protein